MKRAAYTVIVIAYVIFPMHVWAQERAEEGVVVHADPRLSILLKKNHTMEPPALQDMKPTKQYTGDAPVPDIQTRPHIVLYKGKGYRVQIYNGEDRAQAIQIKTDFMRRFPGTHTYLSYISPSFRVKIGDYRDRSDAAGMMREAKSMYSPCMIVPDMVTVTNY